MWTAPWKPTDTKRYWGNFMYCTEEAKFLVDALNKKGLKIATAESCTGGLISGAITAVSGASAVFDGSICSYANEVKAEKLGVPQKVLDGVGAVSSQTAAHMAKGAIKLFGADIAVAVTGIAGPGGGTPKKPVGTVYIAVSKGNEVWVRRYNFSGSRETVRYKTVLAALNLAIMMI